MPKKPKNFSHLNDAIPMLAEANAAREAKREKAEQAKEANALAQKVISAGRKAVK